MKELHQIDLAYLAGIIDGEGWMGIKKSPRLYPEMSVEMSNKRVIDYCKYITGLGSTYPRPARKEGYKPTFIWCVNGKKLIVLLLNLLPYLLVKHEQAQLICSTSLDDSKEYKEKVHFKIKELNHA